MESLHHDIGALATALVQREREDAAAFKAWRQTQATASAEEVRREHLRNAFVAWARTILEVKLRQADIALRPARYALTQTLEPGRPHLDGSVAPGDIIAQTTLVLARDYARHQLTIALHADGTVRARRGPDESHPHARDFGEPDVFALSNETEDRLIAAFVRNALPAARPQRSVAETQGLHRTFW